MNINQNVLNIINEVVVKYNLSGDVKNEIIRLFQFDVRDINVLRREIEKVGVYYFYVNKLEVMKRNTLPLQTGYNYYITAFDASSNIYLQPVSVNVLNSETNEVMVDNTFKGYMKHTNVDDIEIALCQIGRLMGFDVVEEYRVYNSNKEKDSIIIRDLINEDEFYDVENLRSRFNKLIVNGKLKKDIWVDECQRLKVCSRKEDYKLIIDYGLNILKSLPSILQDDYNLIEKKYFEMLIYDAIINQSERNFKDYGILCDKVTKRYRFAPLFDNVFPSILKNNDIMQINGITCNRYELMECLFYNYYDKIEEIVNGILSRKDIYLKNIDVILKYNVDFNTYNMVLSNIISNINYFEKLIEEKKIIEERNKESAGFVNMIQLVIGLLIIMAFSVCIGYLLYCVS